jgi:antirestriction protein ArdC
MANRRRQPTAEERAERRRKERELVESAVRSLLTSEGWRRWVRVRATFRRYSPANTWLIALQAPDATRVAGFRAWLGLNRCVRKGERGIRIWAPMTVKRRDDEGRDLSDERGDPLTVTRFRMASVFDVSQTDPLPGTEPVPLEPPSQPVTGDSHAALMPSLVAFAASLGVPVGYEQLPQGTGGYFDPRECRIALASGRPANATVRTLVHELCHALVRQLDQASYPYEREEVIVETATYIVCQAAGLDTAGVSIPYVASWGEQGELEAVQRCAEAIDAIARRLEAVIEAAPSDAPERPTNPDRTVATDTTRRAA